MEKSQENAVGTPSGTSVPEVASSAPAGVGRRRLIKAGAAAVPVAATLVSRPAFAWHGRTPSAWGSAPINTNSSLQADNQGIVDETWIIANWISNESRASLGNPWNRLAAISGMAVPANSAWFRSVTFKQLFDKAGSQLVVPSGASFSRTSTTPVVSWLNSQGSSFAAILLVAQLNRILLSSVQKIVKLTQLQDMARGTFTPDVSGQATWNQDKIVTYLDMNYIVRTSAG
jgi:hypothetical protein